MDRRNAVRGSTGDGMDEVDRVGHARDVPERPVKGVLGVRAEVDGDEEVPAAAPLPGLPLELRLRAGNHGDEVRQHYLPPAVLLHVLLHCLHRPRAHRSLEGTMGGGARSGGARTLPLTDYEYGSTGHCQGRWWIAVVVARTGALIPEGVPYRRYLWTRVPR
jgi:hypothetical protein